MKRLSLLLLTLFVLVGGGSAQTNLAQGKHVYLIGDAVGTNVTEAKLQGFTDGLTDAIEFAHYDENATPQLVVQSWYLDLGEEKSFNNIKILWEGATAKEYTIYAGNSTDDIDKVNWGTAIVNETNLERSGGDKTRIYSFDTSQYRYLKFVANNVDNYNDKGWNVKIKEFYVYNLVAQLESFTIPNYIYKAKTGADFYASPKDNIGNTFSGNVTYSISPTETTGFVNNESNHIVWGADIAAGIYTITATDESSNVATKKIGVVAEGPTPPSYPSDNVHAIYSDTYNATNPGISESGWNWKWSSKDELTFSDGNKCYRIHNVGTIGFNNAKYNVSEYTDLEFDIYAVENVNGYVTVENSDINNKAFSLTGGQWNHISIDISGCTNLTQPTWIQFYIGDNSTDNQRDILIDNILFKKGSSDPVLTTVEATATMTELTIGGSTATITATGKDKNGDDFESTITYASSNTAVATVSDGGVVTPKGLGTTTITVTATAGGTTKTATIDFTVVLPAPTAPQDEKENVLAAFSRNYTELWFGNPEWNGGVGQNLWTRHEIINAAGEHKIEHITGAGFNGRPYPYNAENTNESQGMSGYNIGHVAIWPTTATKGKFYEDNKYSEGIEFSLIPGQWNYITVPVNFTTQLMLVYLTTEDGTPEKEFYLDHFYVAKDNVTPVLNTAALLSADVASATLSLKATDEIAANVNYNIVVKKDGTEDAGTTYTTTGANGADITYTISGLDLNTDYTATVTANDGANNSNSIDVKFTTGMIPPAATPTATSVASIYSDHYTDNNMKDFTVGAGGSVSDVEVATNDNVKYVSGTTTFTVIHNGGAGGIDIDPTTYATGTFAIYPTGTTNQITIDPKFYNSNVTVSKTFEVVPNQWNYITFKTADIIPEDYKGKDLCQLIVTQPTDNPIFFDNFYYTSTQDVTAPVESNIRTNAAASYVVFTLNYTDDTDNGNLVYKIWNSYGGYEGDVTGIEGQDTKFRINNLDPGKTYSYTLKVWDEANNESVARSLTATTPTVTGDLRVNNTPNDPEADRLKAAGMVYLTGVWDKDKFIAIDQQYCATAYDLTEVDFTNTGDDRLDRDKDYFTFNPNAILVSPKLNKFNINYVMYERDGVTLTAFNFDMRDGDFKAATYYANNPMKEMILDGIDNLATYKYKNGLDAGGYLKLDPFTGFKKIITGQNFAFSRNITDGDGQGADKFGTVVLPFPVNIAESNDRSGIVMELYRLNTAEKDAQGNINLKFEQVEGVSDMNTPYLIKSTADTGGGTIYFIDNNVPKALNFPEGNKEAMKEIAVSNDNGVELFGSYVTYEAESNGKAWEGYSGYYHSDIYGLPGGNKNLTLNNMAAGSILPAWRAAVKVSDVAEGAKITMEFVEKPAVTPEPEDGEETDKPGEGTETTKITRPATDEEIQAVLGNVYSIDGRQVRANKNPYLSLPAGIYIVNGKKVVVK